MNKKDLTGSSLAWWGNNQQGGTWVCSAMWKYVLPVCYSMIHWNWNKVNFYSSALKPMFYTCDTYVLKMHYTFCLSYFQIGFLFYVCCVRCLVWKSWENWENLGKHANNENTWRENYKYWEIGEKNPDEKTQEEKNSTIFNIKANANAFAYLRTWHLRSLRQEKSLHVSITPREFI